MVVLFLVACGLVSLFGGSHDSGTATPTSTAQAAPTPAPPSPSLDAETIKRITFTAYLDSKQIPYPSVDEAVKLAHTICTALDGGNSVTSVELEMLSAGGKTYTAGQLGDIMGSAVQEYCPQYSSQLGPN